MNKDQLNNYKVFSLITIIFSLVLAEYNFSMNDVMSDMCIDFSLIDKDYISMTNNTSVTNWFKSPDIITVTNTPIYDQSVFNINNVIVKNNKIIENEYKQYAYVILNGNVDFKNKIDKIHQSVINE